MPEGAGREGRHDEGSSMITLCIRYQIDHNKQSDFEAYAAACPSRYGAAGGT